MKLHIITIFFKSIFFFIRHIILFVLLNSITYYFFNKFFYNVLDNLFSANLSRFINGVYINPSSILLTFLIITKIITKISFYTIAINNDVEDVKNDLTIYIGDFINNMFYIFISGYAFLFVGLLASAPIITSILYFNCCIFFMIYVIEKRKDDAGTRYTTLESISKSFSITKGNRIKIIFFNTIVICFCIFCFYFMPEEIIVNKVNISYLLKMFVADFLIVYLTRVGFELDKIETARIEEVAQKELERQHSVVKGRSDFD